MSISVDELKSRLRTAIELAVKSKKRWKYKQSVELILTFKGVDIKKQQEFKFRENVYLPHGLGKEPRICIVVDDGMAQAFSGLVHMAIARSEVQNMDKKTAKKIAQKCDFVLVRAPLMGLVGKSLGPSLGPRGKAPIPIPANVDIVSMIEQYRKMTKLRSKDQPWVGCSIGIESMSVDQLVDNAIAVLKYIEDKIKRPLIQTAKIYVKTSSSPAIEVY